MDQKSSEIAIHVAFKAAVESAPIALKYDEASIDVAFDGFEAAFTYYKDFLFAAVREETEAYAPQRSLVRGQTISGETEAVQALLRDEGMVDEQSQGFSVEAANEQTGPWPVWLLQELEPLGIRKVWDNRKTATGNQPLFKEFVPKGQRGHGRDGDAKPFWAPKG